LIGSIILFYFDRLSDCACFIFGQIPVLALVDSDPEGVGVLSITVGVLKILSVYMQGSKNMAYDSASLSTPDIKVTFQTLWGRLYLPHEILLSD
jgi:hypothetical protein